MEYIYIYKIYKGSDLMKNRSNFKKIYNAFKRTYEKSIGSSFDESVLRSKMRNWDIYGNIDFDSDGNIINEQRLTFISYMNMEESNVLKINSIVGDNKEAKFDVMAKFSVNFASSPIFTGVTERLSNLFERYGMIRLSTPENRNLLQAMAMFGIIPGMENAKVNKDGSMNISLDLGNEVTTTSKYLMCNAKLISFLYGYYKFGMLEYRSIPMLDDFFKKHEKDLYHRTKYKPSKDYIADQMSNRITYDTDVLPTGKEVTRRFFSEHLDYYSPGKFERQYAEVKDEKFLKTNFLFVHAFGMYKTDFRVDESIDSLNNMIKDFKSKNQKIDLSCYYVDKSKSTVKSFINKGLPSKDKILLLVDGEVAFANTIDSKSIADYGREKSFEEFNEEIYKTLFWDKNSYEEAKMNSFEDEVGEVILRNWSITGIIINKSGAYPNAVDTKDLSMISVMNNIPVYLMFEKSVASTDPEKQTIEVKEDKRNPVTLKFNDGLKAMQASMAEKTLRSTQYLIGHTNSNEKLNFFDHIISLENSKLIGKRDDEIMDDETIVSGDEEIYESSYVVDIDKQIDKLYRDLENKDLNFILSELGKITKASDTYVLDLPKIDQVLLSKMKSANFEDEQLRNETLEKLKTFEGNYVEFELPTSIEFLTNYSVDEEVDLEENLSFEEGSIDKLSSIKKRTFEFRRILKGI